RIKIDDYEINGGDLRGFHGMLMLVQLQPGKNTRMDFGVQRFDAAIEHFRKTGVITDLGDSNSLFLQGFCGTSRREDSEIHLLQRGGESNDSCFIRNTD